MVFAYPHMQWLNRQNLPELIKYRFWHQFFVSS